MLDKRKLNALTALLNSILKDLPGSPDDFIASVKPADFQEITIVLAIDKLLNELNEYDCTSTEFHDPTYFDIIDILNLIEEVSEKLDNISDYFNFTANPDLKEGLKSQTRRALNLRKVAQDSVNSAIEMISENEALKYLETSKDEMLPF